MQNQLGNSTEERVPGKLDAVVGELQLSDSGTHQVVGMEEEPHVPVSDPVIPLEEEDLEKLARELTEKTIQRFFGKIPVPQNMQKIVGAAEASSLEISKRIREYAKKRQHGCMVECDEALSEALLGETCVHALYVPSIVAKQLPSEPPYKYPLSQKFQVFLGTGETELERDEALYRVRRYIKANQLLDVSTKTVRCDAKLQELFGCETTLNNHVNERTHQHLLGCRFVRTKGCNFKRLNLPRLQR